MSVEFIAESLLRRAKPRSPVLKDWISKILADPKFSSPPLIADYQIRSADLPTRTKDEAIYKLASKLVDYRSSGGYDKPLSEEIMLYYDLQFLAGMKRAKNQGFKTHFFMRKRH